MSKFDDELNALTSLVWCPWCGALPGAPCRTASTSKPTGYHTDRLRPVREAYSLGYVDGEDHAREG